jgi:ubiquitin-protein ligase
MKEAQDVQANPLPGISLTPSEGNLAEWHANIMVSGGQYDGLVMHILLDCPHDYPNSAPKAYFVNPVSYQSGATEIVPGKGMSVCLNLFGNFAHIHREWGTNGEASGWSVSYTLQTALLTLQGLLPVDMLSTQPSCVSQSMAQSHSCKCSCGHSGARADLFRPSLPLPAAVAPQSSMPSLDELRQAISQGLTLQGVQLVADVQWLCLSTADGQNFYACSTPPAGFVMDAAPCVPQPNVMCYALHKTLKSDPGEIFGFGVAVERQNVSTPAEVLCKEAFDSGIRTSSQNVLFQHFVPLFVSDAHWLIAKPVLFAATSKIWSTISRVPEPIPAVAAARVVCRLMNNVVIDVMKADGRSAASDTFISGYFSLLRILVRLASDHPEVQQVADKDWGEFMASSENRNKDKCPNIGDILPLLCISSRFSWPDVAAAYQEESHIRNVRWYLHDHPSLASVNPNKMDNRVSITFSATAVSRRMACFQAKFSTLGKAQSPFAFADGTVPAPLIAAIKDTYRATDAVSS